MGPVTRTTSTQAIHAAAPRPAALGIGVLVALLAALLAGLVLAGPAHASVGSTSSAGRDLLVVTDARKDAAAMRASAISLRRDVSSLLQQYIDQYGARVTPAELSRLEGYRSDADRQLAGVVVTTSRLRNAIAQGRSARQVESARRAALASWTRAREAADSSWDQARTIMEPQLSFLERLSALSDYNDMIGRFDALGEEIRTVGS